MRPMVYLFTVLVEVKWRSARIARKGCEYMICPVFCLDFDEVKRGGYNDNNEDNGLGGKGGVEEV